MTAAAEHRRQLAAHLGPNWDDCRFVAGYVVTADQDSISRAVADFASLDK